MRKHYARPCAYCGMVFTASRPDAKYCSNACRSKAYRARQHKPPITAHWQPLLDWRSYARLQAVSPDAVRVIRELAETCGPDAGELALRAVLAFASNIDYQWPDASADET